MLHTSHFFSFSILVIYIERERKRGGWGARHYIIYKKLLVEAWLKSFKIDKLKFKSDKGGFVGYNSHSKIYYFYFSSN